MKIKLNKSYKFDINSLSEGEKSLFLSLPGDYQYFLRENNGGIVDDPNKSVFKTEIIRRDNAGRVFYDSSNGIEEFWGFLSYDNSKIGETYECPMSILHQHIDKHLTEEFLPANVFVIGRCIQHSLIAISLNEFDYGSIYYWEWYWKYPWYKQYFHKRITEAANQYKNVCSISANEQHPLYSALHSSLNYATLVKISPSFSQFINNLYEEKVTITKSLRKFRVVSA